MPRVRQKLNKYTDSTAFKNHLFTSVCKLGVFTGKTLCDFSPVWFPLFTSADKTDKDTVSS